MSKGVKLLMVEDDENLRFLCVHRLKSEGYEILECDNGAAAMDIILSEKPDIVLLDWMLPDKEGPEVCEQSRNAGFEGLIIMLTAKAQDVDKIDAYHFGASDYVTKPFNIDVLIAMLESKAKFVLNNDNADLYRFGDMEHHPNIHTVFRDERKIELTILENRILLYFLRNSNKVVSRDALMLEVWGYSSDVNTRTLDMHIVRLRKKIETNPDNPQLLQTIRGTGYRFNVT